MKRRTFLQTSAAAVAGASVIGHRNASAQTREETLRVLDGGMPNSFDPSAPGGNADANGMAWNVYDRLITFDRTPQQGAPGAYHYDYNMLRGEIAESFEVSSQGTAITFKLRRDATFHDGRPVTSEDVKWSMDRAVNMPVSKGQFSTGSMTSTEQFVAVDPHTFRIDLPRADRFALPNLALVFPQIYNSRLAKQHATQGDPWAAAWLKTNAAGGGAYKVEAMQAGQQIVYSRFDNWKSGPLPHYRRVIHQVVPATQTRVAALQRGDADIVLGLAPREVQDLGGAAGVKVVSVPMRNAFQLIGMNNQTPPFDNVKVRQAVAAALPYQAMYEGALLKRGRPLFGGTAPAGTEWPGPQPYKTDIDAARRLLAEAGLPNGFETTFSYNIAFAPLLDPMSALIQESLARVGIRITINKVPGAQMGTLLTEKKVPFFFEQSAAWLASPDYVFRIFYTGASRWNFGSINNAELNKLIADARWEADQARYNRMVTRMTEIAVEQVPVIMLWQPSLDVAMRGNVNGYTYFFHRQVDYRKLTRG